MSGKNKLMRFEEMATFPNVLQPRIDEIKGDTFYLKGRWTKDFFRNNRPLVLELGCGKGEYTTSLAAVYPENNYIGVDIKGARMWRGAKTALENDLKNVAFLRTRIELISQFFAPGEVSEIWVTFPDPQLKKRRNKKRLTNSLFLNQYRQFMCDRGIVHLKTDNEVLYQYTHDLVTHNRLPVVANTDDLYQSHISGMPRSVQTHYEQIYLGRSIPIKYISFQLPANQDIDEPLTDEE